MITILSALGTVRRDLVKTLRRSTVERICRRLDYEWRDRQLDPYTTLHLFLLQVLNYNTAMTHLPHLYGEQFTASAHCQARKRLPRQVIEEVVNQISRQLGEPWQTPLWKGRRGWITDDSRFSMPDTPVATAA